MLREAWTSILEAFRPWTYGPQFLGEERPWVERWKRKRDRKRDAA